MIYYSRLYHAAGEGAVREDYPFHVPAVRALGELCFEREVTLICGNNGSGKSTLMELLAQKMNAVRIGDGVLPRKNALRDAQDHFNLSRRLRPSRCFYFSAEEFIAYITWVENTKEEARREMRRIDEDDSVADKAYAKMPWARTLYDLEALYTGDLARQSHGEGFLDFFRSRLKDGGVYLLDEPEGALSYENQYVLALLILDAVRHRKCQFILATNSPVLTALPGAQLYRLSESGFEETDYADLPDVQFLKLFLERHQRMLSDEEDDD